jgi:hypothetical protein
MYKLIKSDYRPRIKNLLHRLHILNTHEQMARLTLASSSKKNKAVPAVSPVLGLSQQRAFEFLLHHETRQLEALLARVRSCVQLLSSDHLR